MPARKTNYESIHGEYDQSKRDEFDKLRNKRFVRLRKMYGDGIISEPLFHEVYDIIHVASLDELKMLRLTEWGRKPNMVALCRMIVKPKPWVPPPHKWHEVPLRSRTKPKMLAGLTREEKIERHAWIEKTRKLYKRMIDRGVATEEDLDRYNDSILDMKFPVEFERRYLQVYLDHRRPSMSQAHNGYCPHCSHCRDLKEMMRGVLDEAPSAFGDDDKGKEEESDGGDEE